MVLTKKTKKPINNYIKGLIRYAGKESIKLEFNLNKPSELFDLKKLIELEAMNYVFHKQVEGSLQDLDIEDQFCGLRPFWETYIFEFIEAYGYITLDVIKKVIEQNIE